MSVQIDTAFTRQYGSTIYRLAAQRGSVLRECVTVDTFSGAEEKFYDQVGAVAPAVIMGRHGDSPLISNPHDRRKVSPQYFECGDMIDTIDQVRSLIDPTSTYTQNHAEALGRGIDDSLLDGQGSVLPGSLQTGTLSAFFGSALSGKTGGTSVPFPAGQVVALNFGGTNVGLTVPKLIDAQRLFRAGNVQLADEMLYIALTSKGIADLLQLTQVTSADYSNVKALVNGQVNSILGFTVKVTERVAQDSAGAQHWRYPVWAKSGVQLAISRDITAEVARRADKRFGWYAYASMGVGSTRLEEVKVVEIKGLI
jgi:hypothetical protein